MYAYKMTKIISIADDAYESLRAMKAEGESFSKVIRRIAVKNNQEDILGLAGSIKDSTFFSSMGKVINSRQKIKSREANFN